GLHSYRRHTGSSWRGSALDGGLARQVLPHRLSGESSAQLVANASGFGARATLRPNRPATLIHPLMRRGRSFFDLLCVKHAAAVVDYQLGDFAFVVLDKGQVYIDRLEEEFGF